MEIRSLIRTQTRGSADAELPLPVPRVPDLSGRILGARYSLRRRIGGGSMGTVYEARDMTLGTAVAVKVMHPEYSDDEAFRKRFHQEALIGARLRHEHSVAVTDLGQSDDGLLYSVMEFLEGESLDALLSASDAPLPWRRVALIAVQVCAALQAAHDRGIIHRDIKPGNCFLVRNHLGSGNESRAFDDDDRPVTFIKVLDLGLARVMPVGGRPTPPGRLGAPEYLAPEQIQGSLCDHRVDLYALGVMMFELLTRRMPFMGPTPSATMRAHLESPPPSLRHVAPEAGIPAGLEAVILRALAKDPAERYISATMMAHAIHSAAAEALTSAEGLTRHIPEPGPEPGLDESDELDDTTTSDDTPTGTTWRRLAPPTTMPTMNAVSAMSTLTSMVLAPDYGYSPSTRRGLVVLGLAFVGICIAVTALWTSNRLLLTPTGETHVEARPAQRAPATTAITTATSTAANTPTVTPPRTSIDTSPLGPIEPVAAPIETIDYAAPPWAEDASPTIVPANAAQSDAAPSTAAPTVAPSDAAPSTAVAPSDAAPSTAALPAVAQSNDAPSTAALPAVAQSNTAPSAPPPDPRRPTRRGPPPPGAFLSPSKAPTPPPPAGRTPGVPLERTFRRLADSVAPGVHRCMRTHSPDLTALTISLTIGGPRHTAVELGLDGADTPDLRACLAPLLARIDFPSTERTARYAFTYRP